MPTEATKKTAVGGLRTSKPGWSRHSANPFPWYFLAPISVDTVVGIGTSVAIVAVRQPRRMPNILAAHPSPRRPPSPHQHAPMERNEKNSRETILLCVIGMPAASATAWKSCTRKGPHTCRNSTAPRSKETTSTCRDNGTKHEGTVGRTDGARHPGTLPV